MCAKLTRPEERLDFVRSEVRAAGGDDHPRGRGQPARCGRQRPAGVGDRLGPSSHPIRVGRIDADTVAAYHAAEPRSAVSRLPTLTVSGDAAKALEALRWALSVGVPQVVIADAIADGVRSVVKVWAAGRGQSERAGAGARHAAVEGSPGSIAGARLGRSRPAAGADDGGRAQRGREGGCRRRQLRPGTGGQAGRGGTIGPLNRRVNPSVDGRGLLALAEVVDPDRHGRLLVGGLVGVDDTLADGLVEFARCGAKFDLGGFEVARVRGGPARSSATT